MFLQKMSRSGVMPRMEGEAQNTEAEGLRRFQQLTQLGDELGVGDLAVLVSDARVTREHLVRQHVNDIIRFPTGSMYRSPNSWYRRQR